MTTKMKKEDGSDFPVSKVELHQWINTVILCISTIALSFLGFVGSKLYDKIENDHDRLAAHEVQLSNLNLRVGMIEDKSNKESVQSSQADKQPNEAVLPDTKKYVLKK